MPKHVAVYGATGHTGTFVVQELLRRGLSVIAVGRRNGALPAGVEFRQAALDDAESLASAFADCAVVIHCAGPFLDTAAAVVDAALRCGCHYLDVTAEQASARHVLDRYDVPARAAGVAVIPAAGFFGGLADLLASALDGADGIDRLDVAIALSRWWPTEGTRRTGARNQVPRVVIEDGQLAPASDHQVPTQWDFGEPFGLQPMEPVVFSEVITIHRHLRVRTLRGYLNASALADIRDPGTPAPVAAGPAGRSAQSFAMEVRARGGGYVRSAIATGQDIYAVTAPLVAEAAERLLQPSFQRTGTLTLGQAFDAQAFLDAIGEDIATRFTRRPDSALDETTYGSAFRRQ